MEGGQSATCFASLWMVGPDAFRGGVDQLDLLLVGDVSRLNMWCMCVCAGLRDPAAQAGSALRPGAVFGCKVQGLRLWTG